MGLMKKLISKTSGIPVGQPEQIPSEANSVAVDWDAAIAQATHPGPIA
jgi:hypothetical protein